MKRTTVEQIARFLFHDLPSPFTILGQNDDSQEKSVCNESGNTIFLESWSRNEPDNNYLLDTLDPWLNRMNMHCMSGLLRKYSDQDWIGCPPFSNG